MQVGELVLAQPSQREVLPVRDAHVEPELALDLRQLTELVGGDVAEAGVRVGADGAVGAAAHDVGVLPPLVLRETEEVDRCLPDLGDRARARTCGRVAVLLDGVGDAAGVGARGGEELALLEDALAQLLHAHRVDQPLHARPQLVVAVAVVVEHAHDRLERRHELLAWRELLERLRGMRVGAEPAGDEHLEAGLERAVGLGAVHADDADVVEHGLAAVGDAAREVDLELARQPLRVRVAQEELGGRLGPRADVEHLERARAGEVATGHVADGVAARLAAGQVDRRQQAQELGRLLELHEVHLHVLAGGEVRPAARVLVGEVPEHLELLGDERAVGDLDPHHLVVPALALAVNALVQAEDPENVLVDLAGEILADAFLELDQLLVDDGVEGPGRQRAHVDGHVVLRKGWIQEN